MGLAYEELEVSLDRHRHSLMQASGDSNSFRSDISALHDEFDDNDPLSHPRSYHDDYQSKVEETHPPRRRRRLIICSSLVFLIGAAVAIYVIWDLGIVGSLKSRQSSSSVSSAVQTGQVARPTDEPSAAPLPSASPSKLSSAEPSLSSFPTTSTPSRMPSKSPRPSGSTIPSNFPSFMPSPLPSQPTTVPSAFPTSPTTSPSFLPTPTPSEAYASAAKTPAPTTSPRVCNGLASNCDRRADEIMYATSHNAMSSQADGFIAFNHLLSMEDSLDAGFRAFLLDSCDCGEDGIKFCHEFCVTGTREVAPLFSNVVSFLYDNPNDIVIIELQVNDDSLLGLWEQVPQAFIDLCYTHTSDSDPWPTLNQMIDMGKRAVVFQHNGPNCDAGECPEGVQGFWRYGFETNWDISTVSEVEDYQLSCAIITGLASRENTFMLNNHFSNNRVGLPSRDVAEVVNMKDFLQNRLDGCTEIVGRRTNLLAVDFWSIGDVVEVVNSNNAALPAVENIFSN